jgi:chloramphenicol-sensitive protein RarD
VAIGISGLGVVNLAVGYGAVPWIALTLALTFGFYGLLRKRATLGPLAGFGLESALMLPPALGYLVGLEIAGRGAFGHAGPAINLLLPLAGVVTALPLLWFTYAAQRVTLVTLGIVQYTTPTLQFLLGVVVYGEVLTPTRLLTFVAVWVALTIYSVEGIVCARRSAATTPTGR